MSGSSAELGDGRKIGIETAGKSGGFPIFHFHGVTSSRLEVRLMASAAEAEGVRLIGLDRPGIGLSDIKRDYEILDWPDDVAEVADILGIDRFAVEGVSAGGAYAMACACKMPARIVSCGLISTVSPSDIVMKSGPGLVRRSLWIGNHFPLLLRLMLRSTITDADGTIHYVKKQFGLRGLSGKFGEAIRESFRNGPEGNRADAFRVVRPWGFGPKDVKCDKLFMWHGEKDTVMPADSARLLAKELSHCQAKFYPGEGHISVLVNHAREIMMALKQ